MIALSINYTRVSAIELYDDGLIFPRLFVFNYNLAEYTYTIFFFLFF